MPLDSRGFYYSDSRRPAPNSQGSGCFDGIMLFIFLASLAWLGLMAWGIIELVNWVIHK